ncbi:MAG: amidohydrolase family protein, partial [Flavobacteriales bacterium]|nr:amidohydrolase family protein [Flavobacteriales bacterium]
STAKELDLFRNDIPLSQKRITAEACIHHLWFTQEQYATKGSRIKWNPAVKTAEDRAEIRKALLDNRIDVVATDHAPHTIEEKNGTYFKAPSGGPLVQHALPAMLEMVHQGHLGITDVPRLMSHHVAECFEMADRGYIREGYKADLVLVDLNDPWTATNDTTLYKCGWTPFHNETFQSKIKSTWVNGQLVYDNGEVKDILAGERLTFNR